MRGASGALIWRPSKRESTGDIGDGNGGGIGHCTAIAKLVMPARPVVLPPVC
jgi:hypothetical protein